MEENEVTQEQIQHALRSLDPALWGFKPRYARNSLLERRALATPVPSANARSRCSLPLYPSSATNARSNSPSTATTVVVSPPPPPPVAVGNPTNTHLESESSTVVVRRPSLAVVSAPFVTPSTLRHPRESGAAAAARDVQPVETADPNEPTDSTSSTDVSSDHSSLRQDPQLPEASSSVSSLSAYTRMESVHATNSARPVARMNLFARRGNFVPMSLCAGVRPTKQCLATTAPLFVSRKASPAPSCDIVDQDAAQAVESSAPQSICRDAVAISQAVQGIPEAAAKIAHSVSTSVDESGATERVNSASENSTPDIEVEQNGEASVSSPLTSLASCSGGERNAEEGATSAEKAAVITAAPLPSLASSCIEQTPASASVATCSAACADPPLPLSQTTVIAAEVHPDTRLSRPAAASPTEEQHDSLPAAHATAAPTPPAAAPPVIPACPVEKNQTVSGAAAAAALDTLAAKPVAVVPPAPPLPLLSAPVPSTPSLTRRSLCRVPGGHSESQSAAASTAQSSASSLTPMPSAASPAPPRKNALSTSLVVASAPSPPPSSAPVKAVVAALPDGATRRLGRTEAVCAAVDAEKKLNAGARGQFEPAPSPVAPLSRPTADEVQSPTVIVPPHPSVSAASGAAEAKAPSPLPRAAPALAAAGMVVSKAAAASSSPPTPQPGPQAVLREGGPSAKGTVLCTVRLCTEAPSPKNKSNSFMRLAAAERFY